MIEADVFLKKKGGGGGINNKSETPSSKRKENPATQGTQILVEDESATATVTYPTFSKPILSL